MFRNLALVALVFASAACRDDAKPFQGVDLSMSPLTDGGSPVQTDGSLPTGGDMAGMSAIKCATGYTDTTVAAMRKGAKSGCFRVGMMDKAVSLVSQGTMSTHSSLFIQDAAGGDFSAVEAQCDTRAKAMAAGYACTIFSTFKGAAAGHIVTVGGFFVYTSTVEFFNVIDSFTDGGAAANMPAPLALTLADVGRTSTTITAAKVNQIAEVALGAATLTAYEWAPAAFKPSPPSSGCMALPYTFGFGLIPSTSAAAGTPGPACTIGTMAMPAATPSTDEILIDTSFYTGFKYSSDCTCAKAGMGNLLAAGESFTKLRGIVTKAGASPAIAPLTNADLGK